MRASYIACREDDRCEIEDIRSEHRAAFQGGWLLGVLSWEAPTPFAEDRSSVGLS